MVPPAELKKKHQAGQTDVVRWWVGRTSNCKRPRWVGSKGTAEGAVAAQTHPGAHFSSQPLFPVDLHRTPPPHLHTLLPRSLSYSHTRRQKVRLQAQILQLASEGPLVGWGGSQILCLLPYPTSKLLSRTDGSSVQ